MNNKIKQCSLCVQGHPTVRHLRMKLPPSTVIVAAYQHTLKLNGFVMKKEDTVLQINQIEKVMAQKLIDFRVHQKARLRSSEDPLSDYEVDFVVQAQGSNREVLYTDVASFLESLSKYEDLDDDWILNGNHNDCPRVPWDEREWHSATYHGIVDHSKECWLYSPRDEKASEIRYVVFQLKLWDQYQQEELDLKKAISLAKDNLSLHKQGRLVLDEHDTMLDNEFDVKIAAYMYDDDPDACIEDKYGVREGVEDPYEGVIKYYDLDSQGDIPEQIAARTEHLFTNISSELEICIPLARCNGYS